MSNIAVNMEDFACKAKLEIPNFTGIKFSSKVLPDMIGVVFNGCNVLYGCDEVAISRQQLFLFNNNKGLEAVPDLQLYLGVLKHRTPLAREGHIPAKKTQCTCMSDLI
jgi:hypothetical protein